MAMVFPPGSPPVSPAPVRTPLAARQSKEIVVKDTKDWTRFFELLNAAILYLLSQPVLLSGLDANKPNATLYPENTRYFSTDTIHESIVIYATPGDPSTASWVLMF